MCYVIPFTLPCCRRTYVSVTKMKDCPADWPKTKCPKELCFQIGSQPDDRDEGTCWRCKAAEADIPPGQRESLRPGIDSADVERFIVTPEEKRSRMEEDGFCWFCGHRCGCELCEPVKIEGVSEALLGRNRAPVVSETRPANKRLKIDHTGGSKPIATASSKSKAKARPQTRSISKVVSGVNSQSPPPPNRSRKRRVVSPYVYEQQVYHQQAAFNPEQQYAGYESQSHIISNPIGSKYDVPRPKPESSCLNYGDQSQVLDPRLFETPPTAPGQVHGPQGQLNVCDYQRVKSAQICASNPDPDFSQVLDPRLFHGNDASFSERPHTYPKRHGHLQDLQSYTETRVLDPSHFGGTTRSSSVAAHGEVQVSESASLSMNQKLPLHTGQFNQPGCYQETPNEAFYLDANHQFNVS